MSTFDGSQPPEIPGQLKFDTGEKEKELCDVLPRPVTVEIIDRFEADDYGAYFRVLCITEREVKRLEDKARETGYLIRMGRIDEIDKAIEWMEDTRGMTA